MFDTTYLSVIGLVLLGIIFLISGIHKIADPQGTQQYMITMGMTWMATWFYLGAVASQTMERALSVWMQVLNAPLMSQCRLAHSKR